MGKIFFKIIIAFFGFAAAYSQDASIDLHPSNLNQEVTFGGDGKLTINSWANGNLSLIAQRLFVDMKLTTFRAPIFANQAIDSPIYDDVIAVIKSIKQVNPNVKIMASVANGDGFGGNFHNAHKFFTQWQGCCPNNIYNLNLTAYASYLDDFMQLMDDNDIYVDYLAPFNEDPADNSDFAKVFDQMNNLGSTERVGLERFALRTSVRDIDDVETVLDIAGSHFYDDENIPTADWDDTWRELVDKSSIPIWHTEATRYTTSDGIDRLIAGMNNIFPAINGGAESIIFYQAVRRFIWANGGISGNIKYTGFKNLVNESANKKVIDASVNGDNMRITAFSNNNTISLHVTNDGNAKTTEINILDGYSVGGAVTRTIWTGNETEVSNSFSLNNVKSWNITVPANSYVHLEIPIVSTNTNSNSTVVHITKRNATDFAIDGNRGGANGQNVYLWNEDSTNVNQQWLEIDRGNGYYSYQKIGTDFAIDGGNGGENRQNVYLWTINENNQNQHWQKVDAGGGAFKLVKRNAPGFAINGGGNGANGQNVNLFDSSNSSQNLQWFITPIDGVSAKSLDVIDSQNVIVYPNPVATTATIQGAANTTVHIYNLNGKIVFTKNIVNQSEVIDLTTLASGIYYLQVKGLLSTAVIKIVKE